MASRQSAAVREMYVRWARELTDPDLDPQQRAENGEHWADITREPGGVDYSETDEPGRPAMWITPKSAAPDRVILGLHGGGFVGGSLYTHRKLFGYLAKAVGAKALLVHTGSIRNITLEANRDKDPFFHKEIIQSLVDLHLSDGYSPKDPLVNPLYADLAGLPPMFIHAGRTRRAWATRSGLPSTRRPRVSTCAWTSFPSSSTRSRWRPGTRRRRTTRSPGSPHGHVPSWGCDPTSQCSGAGR